MYLKDVYLPLLTPPETQMPRCYCSAFKLDPGLWEQGRASKQAGAVIYSADGMAEECLPHRYESTQTVG